MKRALPLLFLMFTFLILTACRPPEDSSAATAPAQAGIPQSVRVETEGEPTLGETPVIVYVLGENSDGVSGATVEVTGDMTHAGMVPVVAEAVESAPGLYRADDFEFTMAGDWILTAEVAFPDGTEETAEAAVTVPGE